jgi:hypothetical protein
MKECSNCLEKKQKIKFYKNILSKDGLFKICIDCHKKKCTDNRKLKRKKTINISLLENEIFKPTLINENYFVSNLGRAYVREHIGNRFINGKFLKLTILNTGYKTIQIDGKKYLIHRLIAECFLKKDNIKNYVNHKDSNRLNNCISNLEWTTFQENVLHGVNKDRYANKLKREQILEIRNSSLSRKELSLIYKVTTTNINLIINKKIWKHI